MNAIFLCGPPGCGKSTYARINLPDDFQIFSTDDLILREAERTNSSYTDVFEGYIDSAQTIFKEQIRKAQQYGLPFIIDQTNCTEQSRKIKLNLIGSEFKKIAVYFPAYTETVLKKKVAERVEKGGHNVPDHIIDSMYKNYRLPQKTEGFDLVVSSSHFIDIMKVMKFND